MHMFFFFYIELGDDFMGVYMSKVSKLYTLNMYIFMLSEIRQRKTNTIRSHFYVESKKQHTKNRLTDIRNKVMGARAVVGGRTGKKGEGEKEA